MTTFPLSYRAPRKRELWCRRDFLYENGCVAFYSNFSMTAPDICSSFCKSQRVILMANFVLGCHVLLYCGSSSSSISATASPSPDGFTVQRCTRRTEHLQINDLQIYQIGCLDHLLADPSLPLSDAVHDLGSTYSTHPRNLF